MEFEEFAARSGTTNLPKLSSRTPNLGVPPGRGRPPRGGRHPRLRALLVQASLEEPEEALGHEDDHGREDETHGDEVVLGEEAGEALAEQEEEGGPRDGAHEGADATHDIEDDGLGRDDEEDEVGGGELV